MVPLSTRYSKNSRPTLPVNGIAQSAGTSGRERNRTVTTIEPLHTCEPAIAHAELTGSRTASHHSQASELYSWISRHSRTSHMRSPTDRLDDSTLHTAVPLRPQSFKTDSTVWDLNRDVKEESLFGWEPSSTASSVSTTTKPVRPITAPQIRYSLNDPVDELQSFARRLRINVPLLLVRLRPPSSSPQQKPFIRA
jgi:hypothetical protein